jgi:hypothetical protein
MPRPHPKTHPKAHPKALPRKPEGQPTRGKTARNRLRRVTSFRTEFDPGAFQPVLPKNLIHRVVPGEAIERFFADWKRAAEVASPLRVWGTRQWFGGAARALAGARWAVDLRAQWLRRGYLIVRGFPAGPV